VLRTPQPACTFHLLRHRCCCASRWKLWLHVCNSCEHPLSNEHRVLIRKLQLWPSSLRFSLKTNFRCDLGNGVTVQDVAAMLMAAAAVITAIFYGVEVMKENGDGGGGNGAVGDGSGGGDDVRDGSADAQDFSNAARPCVTCRPYLRPSLLRPYGRPPVEIPSNTSSRIGYPFVFPIFGMGGLSIVYLFGRCLTCLVGSRCRRRCHRRWCPPWARPAAASGTFISPRRKRALAQEEYGEAARFSYRGSLNRRSDRQIDSEGAMRTFVA